MIHMTFLKKSQNIAITILALGIFFSGVGYANTMLWEGIKKRQISSLEMEGIVPDGEKMKPLLFGFDNLVADMYFIKTIQYLGDNIWSEDRKTLYPYLDLVTDLDPHFSRAYKYGLLLLPEEGKFDETEQLIEKGIEKNSEDWRVFYNAGYFYFFYKEDKERALELYEHCEKMEGCIKGATRMRKNLKTHIGKYEIAVQERVMDLINPDATEEEVEMSKKKIQEATSLLFLNDAARQYEQQKGKKISHIDDLRNFSFSPENIVFLEYILETQKFFGFEFAITNQKIKVDDVMLISPYKWNGYQWSEEENRVRTKRF